MQILNKRFASAVCVGVVALGLGVSSATGFLGTIIVGAPVFGPPIPDLPAGTEAVAILVTEGGTLTGPVSQTTIIQADGVVTRTTTFGGAVGAAFGLIPGPNTTLEFGVATPAQIKQLQTDLFLIGADQLGDQIAPFLADAPPSTLAFFSDATSSNEFSFYFGLPGPQAQAGAIVTSFTDAVTD